MVAVRSTFAAFALSLMGMPTWPARASDPVVPSPYRVNRLFYGCWKTETHHPERQRWRVSSVSWCFERGRQISGITSDAGDGWDYCLRWRVDGQHLIVDDGDVDVRRCRYAFSEDRRTLILKDCPSAQEWQRDDRMTDVTRGPRTCRPHERPESEDRSDVKP